MKLRIAVLITALALPAAAFAATPAGGVLAPNCTEAQYKPPKIVLACGDGSNYLAKLRWSSWTKTTAAASGTNQIDNCTPDCVSGHFKGYAVTVTLSKPVTCKQQPHKLFSHIVLTYPHQHPGRARTTSGRLRCPPALPQSY